MEKRGRKREAWMEKGGQKHGHPQTRARGHLPLPRTLKKAEFIRWHASATPDSHL